MRSSVPCPWRRCRLVDPWIHTSPPASQGGQSGHHWRPELSGADDGQHQLESTRALGRVATATGQVARPGTADQRRGSWLAEIGKGRGRTPRWSGGIPAAGIICFGLWAPSWQGPGPRAPLFTLHCGNRSGEAPQAAGRPSADHQIQRTNGPGTLTPARLAGHHVGSAGKTGIDPCLSAPSNSARGRRALRIRWRSPARGLTAITALVRCG